MINVSLHDLFQSYKHVKWGSTKKGFCLVMDSPNFDDKTKNQVDRNLWDGYKQIGGVSRGRVITGATHSSLDVYCPFDYELYSFKMDSYREANL